MQKARVLGVVCVAWAAGCAADSDPETGEVSDEVVVGSFGARFDDTVRGGGVVVAGDTFAGRSILLAQGAAEINLTGIPAGAVVDRALLYWAISGGTDTTLTFEGQAVTGAQVAMAGDTCWNTDNFVFRADVTSMVAGNGNYDITGLPSSILFSGIDTDGVGLVVTYRQPSSPVRRRVVIRDGAISINDENDTATDTFPGLAAPLAGTGRFHMVVGDGQATADGSTMFGATNLGTNQWQGGEGSLWDTQSYDVPITVNQASATWTSTQDDDCLLFVAGVLDYTVGVCGDGAATGGEACDDSDATSDDGCSSFCVIEPGWTCTGTPSDCTETCGDGLVVGDETCDDGDTDAGDGCSATCQEEPGFDCTGAPSTCTTVCGDGIVAGAEACDDDDTDPGDGCSATCTIEPGFECAGSPSVCATECGDGIVLGDEACDDGDTDADDGCSATCEIEDGWSCTGEPSVCTTDCGDGEIAGSEQCDDGDTDDDDGCSATCQIEPGNTCTGEPSVCAETCGDGMLDDGEVCDDGNLTNDDGCSDICRVDDGFECAGEPSDCAEICGDGLVVGDEACDDGNDAANDGCSATCAVEPGFECAGAPSDCDTVCGDEVITADEACDDGNLDDGDGCSAACVVEPDFVCEDAPSVCTELSVAGGGCAAGGGGGGGWLAALAIGMVLGLRRRRGAAAGALVLAAVATPTVASAQVDDTAGAYSAERFQLSQDRDGILSVESARTPGHLAFDLGMWLGYADDPLTVRGGEDRERLASLVSHRVGGALAGAIGLGTRFELGVAFPLILSQDQDLGDLMSTGSLSSFGLGDLQLVPKAVLVRGDVDVALALRLTAPTSSADDYTGEDGVTGSPILAVGATRDDWRVGGHLGYRMRGAHDDLGIEIDDELFVDLGAGVRVAPSVELLASVAIATPAASPFGDWNNNFTEARGGVGFDVNDQVRLFAAGGAGLAEGWGTADWRALAGVWIGAGRQAAVAPVIVAKEEPKPEPEPPYDPDADHDRINIPTDGCPTDPENYNGFQDEDGCPDEIPDTDADGIDDLKDGCRDQPEDFDKFSDDDGCPETENDNDGVTDAVDRCPDEAGPVENGGCPDTDRDGDTVVDRLDNCPDEKGTVKNHGCKDKQLVVFTGDSIQLLDIVYFKLDKAVLEKKSTKLLNNVAAVLKAHPEVSKVTVEGHTDDQGDDAYNQDLSQRRAQAVVDFLIAAGVSADILTPIGYGESRPVIPKKTKKARAANRRVEFKLEGISAAQP